MRRFLDGIFGNYSDESTWETPWRSLGLGTVEAESRFWIAISRENKEFSGEVATGWPMVSSRDYVRWICQARFC